jgi:hypothetical protein
VVRCSCDLQPPSAGRATSATTTRYTNVSTAADLSADIEAIDLASQADGGNDTQYLITLQAGATLRK